MTVRDETAKTPCETGARSMGTDTLPRVCAWCLSPSEPKQYVEVTRGESARRP